MKNMTMALSGLAVWGFVSQSFATATVDESRPDRPLSVTERAEVETYSAHFNTTLLAIRALFHKDEVVTDPAVLRLVEHFRNCQILEQGDGQVHLVEGQGCGIRYEISQITQDLGLNETGDPITEVTTEDRLTVVDESLKSLTGVASWRTSRLDHYDTLVSTPVEVRVTDIHGDFVMADGKVIESSSHGRLYTNMETQDDTFYRTQTLKFDSFAVRFEITAELSADGLVKTLGAKLNEQPSTLGELLSIFKPVQVGLDDGRDH